MTSRVYPVWYDGLLSRPSSRAVFYLAGLGDGLIVAAVIYFIVR